MFNNLLKKTLFTHILHVCFISIAPVSNIAIVYIEHKHISTFIDLQAEMVKGSRLCDDETSIFNRRWLRTADWCQSTDLIKILMKIQIYPTISNVIYLVHGKAEYVCTAFRVYYGPSGLQRHHTTSIAGDCLLYLQDIQIDDLMASSWPICYVLMTRNHHIIKWRFICRGFTYALFGFIISGAQWTAWSFDKTHFNMHMQVVFGDVGRIHVFIRRCNSLF